MTEREGSEDVRPKAPLLHYYRVFAGYAGRKLHFLVVVVLLAGLFEGFGVTMLIPLLSEGGVASAETGKATEAVRWLLGLFGVEKSFTSVLFMMAAVFIVKGLITLGHSGLAAHIHATLTKDLRTRVIERLSESSYANFLKLQGGFLINAVTVEAGRATAAFTHYVNTLVGLIYVTVYGLACVVIDWRAAIAAVIVGVGSVWGLKFLHALSYRISTSTSQRNAGLQELIIQTIEAFKYLRATDRFPALLAKLRVEISGLARLWFRLGFVSGAIKSVTEPTAILVLVGFLYVNVQVLGQSVASMLVMVFLLFRMITRLVMTQVHWQKLNGAVGGLEVYQEALARLADHPERSGTIKVTSLASEIVLEDVSFSYGDTRALDQVNLVIRKNTTVGLVGRTGSGKSTLVNILTGMLEPSSGEVRIDDTNLRAVNKAGLRGLIGYVTQESLIFRDSVANNISFWSESDPEDVTSAVRSAAESAHADSFIQQLEHAYDTVLGDRGMTISGGQRQLISIARELYKGPEILLLDEAMSALDAQSERAIQETLTELKGQLTVILVTHRLSTVKECDYVYVLDRGRVVQEGTYEELQQDPASVFAGLAELQKL